MLDFIIALMVMPLGLLASIMIDVIWSEHNAHIVSSALRWSGHRWLILVTIVAGFWIDLCSAAKRARDLGVEIGSPLLVPLHLFNPFSQARMGRLIASPGVDRRPSGIEG